MRRDGGRGLHGGDAVLHRVLHLLEGAHLDLPHPLARDAELVSKLLERDRIIREAPRLEDAPLALVEHVERLAERLAAVVELLALGPHPPLAPRLLRPPIPALARIAAPPARRG